MKYISVNNAVLLCEACAQEHRKLHSGISYVMSIADAGETYSLQKVELLKFGGNDRFRQFIESFKVREPDAENYGASVFAGWPIRDKYSSNACKYYRHKIQMLARQETPQLDCPDVEEAKVIMDEDIEDWIFVADEEKEIAMIAKKGNPYPSEGEVHESSIKEFFHERKEDLKIIKEEAKSIFGKVSAFGKKAFSKKPPEATPPVMPEKASGIKVFGSKVKMGFSKLFSKKASHPADKL